MLEESKLDLFFERFEGFCHQGRIGIHTTTNIVPIYIITIATHHIIHITRIITSHPLKLILLSTTKTILLVLSKPIHQPTTMHIMLIKICQKVKKYPAATKPRIVVVFLQRGYDLVVEEQAELL